MSTESGLDVSGFRFAACAAGIKKSGKLDLALIFSETPARCAGVYTTNKVVAAPVVLTKKHLQSGVCQAILVNSGNANACTGEQGRSAAEHCGRLAAKALGIDTELVAIASTGVIGVPLPVNAFERAVPYLAELLSTGDCGEVAEAIRTTDAFAKTATAIGTVADVSYRLVAIAKGAGMIHPNMATMLAFVMTDACVESEVLDESLRMAVDQSFNCITVDRDTSTNDMVLVLANGCSGGAEIRRNTPEAQDFAIKIRQVLLALAKMIVKDGEGATKLVEIVVRGAATAADAKLAAEAVATSSLVKTAFFGEDANWGRIIAAVGYSGAKIDPDLIDISFDNIAVVRQGIGTGKELETEATEVLRQAEFSVVIDLHLGPGEGRYYTSDLTYDYVKCNADYRS